MTNLPTVNVVEMVSGTPISLKTFSDTQEGNKEAEELFAKVMLENDGAPIEVEDCIENGAFSNDDYSVFLIHSN